MATFHDRNLTVEVRWQEAGAIVRVETPDRRSDQIHIPRALAPQVAAALCPDLIYVVSWLLELAQNHGLVDADDDMAAKAQAYLDLESGGGG